MADISIQILDPGQYIVERLGDASGRVFLDLDDEFGLRLTKVLEEITELNQITQEAALATSIPETPKNRLILDEYEAFILKRTIPSIRIQLSIDGHIPSMGRLRVLEAPHPDKRIEVELYGGGWIEDAEACRLADLELGNFEYTQANVLASWADTTALAVAAPANYGFFLTPGDLTRSDLRFKFNLWKLLKQAFCAIGWGIKSPFYEGAIGSRFYGYLSGENWFSYSSKNSDYTVITDIPAPQVKTGSPEWVTFNEVQDLFNHYDVLGTMPPRAQYRYFSFTDIEIRLKVIVNSLTVELPANNPAGVFRIDIIKERGTPPFQTSQTMASRTVQGATDQTVTQVLNFEFIDEDLNANALDIYFVKMEYQTEGGSPISYTLRDGIVTYIPDFRRYVDDDEIPLAELIDPEISCKQLFDAMAHLVRGLIVTDFAAKVVTLYSPYDIQLAGELVEGYFQRNNGAQDLTRYIVPDSRILKIKDSEKDRFVLLRFANPGCAYISNFSELEHPFSRLVDLGEGKSNTTDLDNPLFEPSLEIFTEASAVGGTGIYLPAHWDNNGTDGRISNKIGPRIGYHHGLVELEDGTTGTPFNFDFEGANRTTLGYITQSPSSNVLGGTNYFEVIFADSAQDLYNLCYKIWLREQFANIDIEFLAWLNLTQYLEFNFREPTAIFYRDSVILYQARAIKDFNPESKVSTPILLKPLDC